MNREEFQLYWGGKSKNSLRLTSLPVQLPLFLATSSKSRDLWVLGAAICHPQTSLAVGRIRACFSFDVFVVSFLPPPSLSWELCIQWDTTRRYRECPLGPVTLTCSGRSFDRTWSASFELCIISTRRSSVKTHRQHPCWSDNCPSARVFSTPPRCGSLLLLVSAKSKLLQLLLLLRTDFQMLWKT